MSLSSEDDGRSLASGRRPVVGEQPDIIHLSSRRSTSVKISRLTWNESSRDHVCVRARFQMFFVGNSGEKGNYTDHREHLQSRSFSHKGQRRLSADTAEGWVHSRQVRIQLESTRRDRACSGG